MIRGVNVFARAFVSAFVLLMLAACTGGPRPALVPLSPQLSLRLPSPGDLGRSLEATQLVNARYGDRTFVFEAHISATPERFLLVALDPLGRQALSITWTDSGVSSVAAPWMPSALRPENMLADLVLLYWPEPSVTRALAGSGGTLIDTPRARSLVFDGKEVLHADYQPGADDRWTGRIAYRNFAWDYQLDIQSAETSR